MSEFDHILKHILRHRNNMLVWIIIVLVALGLLLLFFNFVKMVIIVLFFITINIILRFYRRILPGIPFEFELIIFGSIVSTLAFGLGAGLAIAITGFFLAECANQFISPHSLINILVYCLVPFMSLLLTPETFVTGGIIIAIVINMIIFSIFFFIGYNIVKNVLFSVSNIIFNIIVFKLLGPIFVRLLMTK